MLDLYNFEVFFMYSRLNVKRSIAFLSIVSDFLVRLFSHSVTAEELPRVCITVLDQLGDLKKIYIQNNFPLICGPLQGLRLHARRCCGALRAFVGSSSLWHFQPASV